MTESENKTLPAFPVSEHDFKRFQNELPLWTGLTKREYFAAMAMQGMFASGVTMNPAKGLEDLKRVCNNAVIIADEILKQLDQ